MRLALGLAAVPIVDDNFFHPEPGTAAGDPLLSGLAPLAILAAIALLGPRARVGIRAGTHMTLGAIVFAVGVPGVYYLRDGSAAFDHYTALLALPAGRDPSRLRVVTSDCCSRCGGSTTAAFSRVAVERRNPGPSRP